MEITPYGVSVILLIVVAVGGYWRITWQLNDLIARMDAREAERKAEQAIRNARFAADN